MMTTTDTTNKYASEFPDGPAIFKITNIEKIYNPAEFWVFHLTDSAGNKGKQTFFDNMLGPILRVLGCNETQTDFFEWDPDMQMNKFFKAIVSHAPDKKDKTKIRQHMGSFEKVDANTVPF
jgi:hypothetical protein